MGYCFRVEPVMVGDADAGVVFWGDCVSLDVPGSVAAGALCVWVAPQPVDDNMTIRTLNTSNCPERFTAWTYCFNAIVNFSLTPSASQFEIPDEPK